MTKREKMNKLSILAYKREKQYRRHRHLYSGYSGIPLDRLALLEDLIVFGTGNITSGTIRIYGVEQTTPQESECQ